MLANKKIVIIGGTTGLGLSAALAFVRHGAAVVVTGRNPDSCAAAERLLGPFGRALMGDASSEGSAEEALELCLSTFGHVDGFYHVAGGSGRKYGDGPLHEISLEGWQKTLDMNLTSVMLSNRAAARYFHNAGHGGTVLNMSSVLGFSPSPRYFASHAYAASKAAIIGFTKAAASYYAPQNIRFNTIAPALVDTPMAQRAATDAEILQFIHSKQPLDGGRIGSPEDLDGMACLLMSDDAAFITGQVFTVDGGWTVSEGQYRN